MNKDAIKELFKLHKTPLHDKFFSSRYNKTRRAKLIIFNIALEQYPQYCQLLYTDRMSIIENLEKECYNYTIGKAITSNITNSWSNNIFCDLYHSTCYKISSNINFENVEKNNTLIDKIIQGTIIKQLPRMSSVELFPEKYRDILDRIEASKSVEKTVKTSALYTCRKCKASKVNIENVYFRAIDEGVNIRITCTNCGHAWNN